MTELATQARVTTAGFDPGAAGVTAPSNPDRRGVFLADVVVELGLADQETIEAAQQAAQETERSLERYLLESGILDEESLSRAIAERNGLDHVDLDEFEVDNEAAQMVTRSAAQRYRAVPIAFASDGALIVAVQDPFDTLGISDIEVMTRNSVRPAIATSAGIDALIEGLPEHPVSRPAIAEPPAAEESPAEVPPEEPSAEEPARQEPQAEEPATEEPATEQSPIEPVIEVASPFEPAPVLEVGTEPALEVKPEIDVEPDTEPEPDPEPEVELEPELELVWFPEPELTDDDDPEAVFELKPELVRFPELETELDTEPEPAASSGGVLDLENELGALQETARRADELAAGVERRITELESTDAQSERLEADLLAAQRRIEELEAQVSGFDTLAEELRATTAKLEEVNRVLEGSVR